MSWTDGKLVSFDCETDSPDPELAHIVTASIVVIDGSTGAVDRAEWLVAVEHEIPAEATAVHGITTEHAQAHGQPAPDVVGAIADVLDRHAVDQALPLIVYNAPFDLTLLDRELRRQFGAGGVLAVDRMRVVDPLVLDKAVDRYRKGKRTLTATSAHYGVPIAEAEAHGSTADALCAARVAWKIGRLYPTACDDLDALQIRQATWFRESARSFRDYLGRMRRDLTDPDEIASLDAKIAGVREEWPMVPYRERVPS